MRLLSKVLAGVAAIAILAAVSAKADVPIHPDVESQVDDGTYTEVKSHDDIGWTSFYKPSSNTCMVGRPQAIDSRTMIPTGYVLFTILNSDKVDLYLIIDDWKLKNPGSDVTELFNNDHDVSDTLIGKIMADSMLKVHAAMDYRYGLLSFLSSVEHTRYIQLIDNEENPKFDVYNFYKAWLFAKKCRLDHPRRE